jgi:hypothetical protein
VAADDAPADVDGAVTTRTELVTLDDALEIDA